MKVVYILAGILTVIIASGFTIWIGYILVNGMRKRIARINQTRKDKQIRRF